MERVSVFICVVTQTPLKVLAEEKDLVPILALSCIAHWNSLPGLIYNPYFLIERDNIIVCPSLYDSAIYELTDVMFIGLIDCGYRL